MALCNMYFIVTLNPWNENETSERHNEFDNIRCAFTQYSSPDTICQVTASKMHKASSDTTLEEGSLLSSANNIQAVSSGNFPHK